MKILLLILAVAISVTLATSQSTSKRTRGRRPTKSRKQIVVPPIDCVDLSEASEDAGDFGPLIRKTQHNSDCKKYFECVISRWISRDCPEGTTFNGQEKGCDSAKSCQPRNIDELYADGIEELKEFMGISDSSET